MRSLYKAVAVITLLLGAGHASSQPLGRAVLRGRVLHPKDTVVFLARPCSLVDPTPVFRWARLSPSGEFSLVLDSLPRPVEASWGYDRHHFANLWLEPGDTLTLTVDARHFRQSLHFAGRAAAANYYRLAQQKAHTDNFFDARESRFQPNNPARMQIRADRYRRRAEAVLREADRRWPLPPALRRQEEAAIRYDWGHALLVFPYDYEYRQPGQGTAYRQLPAAYYAFLRELPLTRDSLLSYRLYRAFAGSYAAYLVREKRQKTPFSVFVPRQFPLIYDTVRQAVPPGATHDYLLAQTLADMLTSGTEADALRYQADFQAQCTNPELRAALDRYFARLADLRAGQSAPDFALTDLQGRPVRLADFRGKLVYLDVWASWCKPCRAEAPALRALQTQFAAEADRVIFLSLSIDTNPAAWHRAVAADHLADAPNQVQVLGDQAARQKLFGRRGIPQYWLLSPTGLVLDANAPRPSNPAAATAIRAALPAAK